MWGYIQHIVSLAEDISKQSLHTTVHVFLNVQHSMQCHYCADYFLINTIILWVLNLLFCSWGPPRILYRPSGTTWTVVENHSVKISFAHTILYIALVSLSKVFSPTAVFSILIGVGWKVLLGRRPSRWTRIMIFRLHRCHVTIVPSDGWSISRHMTVIRQPVNNSNFECWPKFIWLFGLFRVSCRLEIYASHCQKLHICCISVWVEFIEEDERKEFGVGV